MAATYKSRVAGLVKLLEEASAEAAEMERLAGQAASSSVDAQTHAQRANGHADAASAAQAKAEESNRVAYDLAQEVEQTASQIEQAHTNAQNKLIEATELHSDASENAKEAELNARKSASSAAEAKQTAIDVQKRVDDVIASHDKIKALLSRETASVLAELYRRDAETNWKTQLMDAVHWVGIVGVVGAIVYLHASVIDGNVLSHAAATLPLWLCVAMIARSFNDRRMVRKECAHVERIITAVVGFKDEFGEETLDGEIKENSPIGKVLVAIERNPAERMKTGTDGIWGMVQGLAGKK